MKILHTSDWHLGRMLHGFLLYDAQTVAVTHIVDQAIAQKVSAVIIAGDVYDRQIPPNESIKLLNSALTRLDNAGITTIITAGNHDGADRISANSNLLKDKVRIVGSFSDLEQPEVLQDEHGPLLIYPITYLHPEIASTGLASEGEEPLPRSHEAVMSRAIELVKADLANREREHGKPIRTVVVAHAFVGTYGGTSKREEKNGEIQEGDQGVSDSERDLSIGGIQVIPSDVFDGIGYVALGHLHGAQTVKPKAGIKTKLRYSGSLLRYSMSERNHQKSFAIIDYGSGLFLTDEHISLHEIPQPRGMFRLQDTVENLVSGKYSKHQEDFVEVIVTDIVYPDSMYSRIKNYFPNLINIHRSPGGETAARERVARVDARNVDPLDVMHKFYDQAVGRALTEDESLLLAGIYEQSRDELNESK